MSETPREPDRFEAMARELMDSECPHDCGDEIPCVLCLAGFLRAAESSALERAQKKMEGVARVWRPESGVSLLEIVQDVFRALIPPAATPECEWRCDACGDELASEAAQRRHEATWHAAAAPAAETCQQGCDKPAGHEPPCGEYAPAAETGKAQGPAAICASCGTGLHAEEIHCDDCADDLREDEVSQDGTASAQGAARQDGCWHGDKGHPCALPRVAELETALRDCVAIVDAAGLLNLSNGVQLGQTSWYVKAFDAFDYARKLISRAAPPEREGT